MIGTMYITHTKTYLFVVACIMESLCTCSNDSTYSLRPEMQGVLAFLWKIKEMRKRCMYPYLVPCWKHICIPFILPQPIIVSKIFQDALHQGTNFECSSALYFRTEGVYTKKKLYAVAYVYIYSSSCIDMIQYLMGKLCCLGTRTAKAV